MNDLIDPVCNQTVNFGCPHLQFDCSPIFSQSEVGDYCRKQFSLLTPGGRDTVMENYCLRHTNAPECKCANRSLNPDYVKLKLGNPYPDFCWYIPCANRFQYFTPSEFDAVDGCPKNICQIVYDISQVHDVHIDNIKQDINCDFKNGGVIPDASTLPKWIYAGALVIFAAFILVYSLKKH